MNRFTRRLIIWQCTDPENKLYFYVLEGTGNRCVLLEEGRVTLDEDFCSFGFYNPDPRSTFRVTKLIDQPLEFHPTFGEREVFCMINNLDMEICKMLEFAFENKEEIFL